jgi:hypothetical protein
MRRNGKKAFSPPTLIHHGNAVRRTIGQLNSSVELQMCNRAAHVPTDQSGRDSEVDGGTSSC